MVVLSNLDASYRSGDLLVTRRLRLSPLALAHLEQVYELLSDPQHTRYLSIPTTHDRSQVKVLLEGMLAPGSNDLWLVSDRMDDSFVGICGFLRDSELPNFMYSISESKKNRGFGFEACAAGIQIGWEQLGMDCIELHIHSENRPSLRIAEKLGFAESHRYQQQFPQDAALCDICVFRKSFEKA